MPAAKQKFKLPTLRNAELESLACLKNDKINTKMFPIYQNCYKEGENRMANKNNISAHIQFFHGALQLLH